MSTQERPNLCTLLSESSRIIAAQPRHFAALSLLFLLPISFSTLIYQFLLQHGKSQFTIQIIYLLFVAVFGFFAAASITYTTSRGFYGGQSVTFISSLKSILVSFFPLLATKLVAQIILGLILFGFGIFTVLAYNGLLLLGVEIDYDSPYFLVFVISIAAVLVAVTIYVQVGWCLAAAVVVVEEESPWGLAALKRSWYLTKGMRWVAFFMTMLFVVFGGILSMWFSSAVTKAGDDGWKSWRFGLETIVCANFWTVLSLYSMVATTVLFIHCKALHGEDMAAFENDDDDVEFGREYVRLPYSTAAV